MRIALILGTNAGQADIISYLKQTGWIVHACGYKKDGPGCALAHEFHLVNTTDIEAVERLAGEIKADIVYSVSSDINIRTATKVSEDLGLPFLLNSEIIDLFHQKERLREFLNVNDINTVKYTTLKSIGDKVNWDIFPCVVKPSDSQGQRGVKFVNRKEELNEALIFAFTKTNTETVIIEEYLTGVEISTNIIVQDSNVIVNEFTERLVFGHEHFGLPKGHSIPIRNVPKEVISEAERITDRLIKKLQIIDAVLYIQLKVTKEGPKIIEVAPRLDGCHIWRLIKHAKGYDLRKYTIECLTGKRILHSTPDNGNEKFFTLAFHHLKTGSKFDENKIGSSISNNDVIYNEYRYETGDIVQPVNGELEVVGYNITMDKK